MAAAFRSHVRRKMHHVRDCDSAHRGAHRVLESGGVFTLPFDSNAEEDIQLVDTSTEHNVYLCKPQIHGDPQPTMGFFAYRSSAADSSPNWNNWGFEFEIHLLEQPEHLIIDGSLPVARKPLGASRSARTR